MSLEVDWEKGGGLAPAIVQDADTGAVLMLGYMNPDSLATTQETDLVTFWSRSKKPPLDQGRNQRRCAASRLAGAGL